MKGYLLLFLCLSSAFKLHAQNLSGVIVYSRTTLPNGSIWINNGSGVDTMLFMNGQIPRVSPNGNHLLYLRNTVPSNPCYGGQWIRRNLLTQTDTGWVNGDFIVGYDFIDSDSSLVVSSACGIYHVAFDNVGINTVIQSSCYDDGPQVRQSDSMVVYYNLQSNIKLTKVDGSGTINLPNTGVRDVWPQWSPDGQWIAYLKLNSAMTIEQNVYKIKPDGTGMTQLSNFASTDTLAAGLGWSPDGQWVITGGIIGGVQSLYAVKADGSGTVVTIPTTVGDPINFVGKGGSFITSGIEMENHSGSEIISVLNPLENSLEINFKKLIPEGTLVLNDIAGKIIFKKELRNIFGNLSIDVHFLPGGIYFLSITTEDGKSLLKKLLSVNKS